MCDFLPRDRRRMRVTCPSCLTQYELPADVAAATQAAGRRLRCAQCGQVWLHGAPAATLQEDLAAAPVPAAPEPEPLPPEPSGPPPSDAALSNVRPDLPDAEPPASRPPEDEPVAPGSPRPGAQPVEHAHPPVPLAARLHTSRPGSASAHAPRPPASPLVWAGWAGSVLVVLAVLALLWIDRGAVMRAVPASAPVYRTLGLAPVPKPVPAPAASTAPHR